ncbi:hypothetical protein HMI55_002982, partial [Coelomomyces lativittatus]
MPIQYLPSCETAFKLLRSMLADEFEMINLTDPLPDYPIQSVVKVCIIAPDPEEIEEQLTKAGVSVSVLDLDHDRNLYVYQIDLDDRSVELNVMEGRPKE